MYIVTRPGIIPLKCFIYIAENLIITCILFCRHEMTCCCYNVCNQSSCVSEFELFNLCAFCEYRRLLTFVFLSFSFRHCFFLSFLELRLLITSFVSSSFSYMLKKVNFAYLQEFTLKSTGFKMSIG